MLHQESSLFLMATGFEIAGVVLGTIPLIIEGIKLYRDVAGKSTRRGFLIRLETLTVELDAEHMILKNTRDIILYDIKASTSIDVTGGSSLGLDNWKEGGTLHQRVEERLGSSASSFRNTAQNMEIVINELMAKLGMDKSGKVCYPVSDTVQSIPGPLTH